MVYNVRSITVWPISVSTEIRTISLVIVITTFLLPFAVIEVANGDYGDFVQQLSTAAKRSTTYQIQKSAADDTGDDCLTPVINVNTLGCIDAPLLKKQLSIDGNGKDAITVPTEWSKFWTLVRRCHVHYYRDWVRDNATKKKI